MPRDIPVGNGRLLVTFDHQYQLRDIYFPHVGQENHAGAGPCHQWAKGLAWMTPSITSALTLGYDAALVVADAIKRAGTTNGAAYLNLGTYINDARGTADVLAGHLSAVLFAADEPLTLSDTTFTFVTDGIESALAQARAAAGGKDVNDGSRVGGRISLLWEPTDNIRMQPQAGGGGLLDEPALLDRRRPLVGRTAVIDARAEICPKCGVRQHGPPLASTDPAQVKTRTLAAMRHLRARLGPLLREEVA